MRPIRNRFVILIAAALLIWGSAGAFAAGQQKKSGDAPKKKEPVEVTADKMRSENKGAKIIFSGNVVGHWGDLDVQSDIMEVYNNTSGGADKAAAGGTDQIVAIGNVVLTRGTRKAKGDRAVYLQKDRKVVLTGSPKAIAWEDKDMIEGKEMVFLIDEDRFLVNDKVRMKFYPREDQEPQIAPADKSGNK